MSFATKAKLDGTDLPVQFSYSLGTPIKRATNFQTAGAVVRQVAKEIIPPDTLISWTCEAMCYDEWKFLFDKFNVSTDTTYPFVGYWGDSFTVKFYSLDPARVRSRLFDVSGSFQVITVAAWRG